MIGFDDHQDVYKRQTLQISSIHMVFCKLVPENTNMYATPSTIPGIVFVTNAMPSIIPLHHFGI